jgi:CDP-glucose 4,6-dehydratase
MQNSFAAFYRGKTTLVTGHTGFIGGWLTAWLKILGARVVGFSLPPGSRPNLFEASRIGRDIVSVTGDIRELAAVSAVFEEHAPQVVFHNAAQSLVRPSYRDPVTTYATNVMGTVHVLEAARKSPSVRAVVIVTSDKCYENREWLWGYREGEALGGHDPYSSSKGCAELVTAAYRRSFFANEGQAAVATARAGNVIGGGDWAEERLVPDIVRGITSGEPILIRRPRAIRPWQNVLEPVRGYLLLGQLLYGQGHSFGEAWNFGPREEDTVPVFELARRMIGHWGAGQLAIQEAADGPHEAESLKLDCSKARARLGWRPLLTLDEALKMCVEWYRGYFEDSESAPQMTVDQIQRYARAAGE